MTKVIAIFVQSSLVDTYINIISHCAHSGVHEIYFVGETGTANKKFAVQRFIGEIESKIKELSLKHKEYEAPYSLLPKGEQIEDRIVSAVFDRPQDVITVLKTRFPDTNNLIVDITCCSKHLAGGILTSFLSRGINHVCYFELVDEVYSSTWKDSNRTRLYHDLVGNPPYYSYIDFSMPGPTIDSINRLRMQGRIMQILLIFSVVLGFIIYTLISGQQTGFAQAFTVLITIISALAVGMGLLTDSLTIFEKFKK